MRLNILRLPVYYINLKKHFKKRKDTHNLLKSLGFIRAKRASGVLHRDPIIGCSLGHKNILERLTDSEEPFIVFEDDIAARHIDHIIDIPDDADAIYLGVSVMGCYDGTHEPKLLVDKVDGYHPQLYRIYNMLGAHAILYINPDYVKRVIEIIDECIDKGIPQDVGIAENMKDWNIYSVDNPMFYQQYKYRELTDTSLSKLNLIYDND